MNEEKMDTNEENVFSNAGNGAGATTVSCGTAADDD
jgi:hypothetical protein